MNRLVVALCAIRVLAGVTVVHAGQPSVTVPVLQETGNTLWLGPLDTQVCYELPEELNTELKSIELVRVDTEDSVNMYTMMETPPDASACVSFRALPTTTDITNSTPSFRLRVVDAINRTTLASTEPFAVASMAMTVSGDSSATKDVFTLRIDGAITQPESARGRDVMRLVDGAGNVTGECPCHPDGAPVGPSVRCSFDIPRQMGAPTRAPYTVLFYSDDGPTAVSALTLYDSDSGIPAALGL